MKVAISVFLSLIILSLFAFGQGFQADKKSERSAIEAAETWLKLIDKGKYSASWDKATNYFKTNGSKEAWRKLVTTRNEALGRVLSRNLKSTKYANLPEGQEWIIVIYTTSFKNIESVTEVVPTMLDIDGKWKGAGYTFEFE
ncbi:MAG: DUF4019 domain-containing protein [Candidatus Omnitrophica bacterium]|nr:DUF4019 domain-containing protein [Candidatus Omnitrophota bacterium]